DCDIEWIDEEEYLIDKNLYVDHNDIVDESVKLDFIHAINFNDSQSWEDYISHVKEYAYKTGISLDDPFRDLLSVSQRVELEKRISEEFTLKSANCDKYDYMIAGSCGLIG